MNDRFNVNIAEEFFGTPTPPQGTPATPGNVNESTVGTPPPIMDMAKNLLRDTTAWAKSGFESSSQEEVDRRLSICGDCEHFKEGRCMVCGCYMALKAKLATGSCPKGKW
jgi:hypothetical protein